MNTFSIKGALKETWTLFKKHLSFFLGLAAVSIVLSYVSNAKHAPLVIAIIFAVASIVWAIVWMKISLIAARGQEALLTWNNVRDILPTFDEVLMVVGVGLLGGLIILCGFILLVIPGIWVAVRLCFASLAYLDRKDGVQKSLRYSWNITKGKHFWTVLLTVLVVAGLYLLGALALGIGLLIAYPLASILLAKLYLWLSGQYHATVDVAVQPVEITPQV